MKRHVQHLFRFCKWRTPDDLPVQTQERGSTFTSAGSGRATWKPGRHFIVARSPHTRSPLSHARLTALKEFCVQFPVLCDASCPRGKVSCGIWSAVSISKAVMIRPAEIYVSAPPLRRGGDVTNNSDRLMCGAWWPCGRRPV
jgi:hypothetical protein